MKDERIASAVQHPLKREGRYLYEQRGDPQWKDQKSAICGAACIVI